MIRFGISRRKILYIRVARPGACKIRLGMCTCVAMNWSPKEQGACCGATWLALIILYFMDFDKVHYYYFYLFFKEMDSDKV